MRHEKEGSETIPLREYSPDVHRGGEAPRTHTLLGQIEIFGKGDNIVHPFGKPEDKCNQLVASSNLAHRAKVRKL
ncbi:MAG: hypothetical protein COX81_03800 [Candidatus Magasanikbacteria bacterium CG_4_10_14_0_2_um_filter_37_12]|uniref:Uncharacterized protein n=1 Tax=Candidatus Magasanikbacteria bacterium CG_4_10_14_0_2_um_filter_37_12 TaxID=1974637 RepID=A0A2M7V6M7_9BACT|nr:MAG: hypothetical protein COX81_03800 [Candidatus Magasanikbacteria bacterium CG_4_10_14_0_2_um_filter_37_12]